MSVGLKGFLPAALMALILSISAILAHFSGQSEFYSIGYGLSFLIVGFIFATKLEESEISYIHILAIFLTWLLTRPLIQCQFVHIDAFCSANALAKECAGVFGCIPWFIHNTFGESISQSTFRKYILGFDDLPELVINLIPYSVSKLVILLAGVTWLSICINIILTFLIHSFITLVSVSLFNEQFK